MESSLDIQEHAEEHTLPENDTQLEDTNIASTSRKRRRSVSQSPLAGAVMASSESSKQPSPNMSVLPEQNISPHTANSCSPPAIIIDLGSPPRLPDTIVERLSFKDGSMATEQAAKTFADHAKAMKLDMSDLIELASWLCHLEQLPLTTAYPEDLDPIVLHQAFWQNIAAALRHLTTLYPFSKITSENPDVFIGILAGTSELTRTLLRVEASCAKSHHERRDSVDENKPQPYHLQYNDASAALVMLLAKPVGGKNKELRDAREGVIDAFINDSTTMSTLIALVHSMITTPDSTHDVLINLEPLLDLLFCLVAHLEHIKALKSIEYEFVCKGLAQIIQSADQSILSMFYQQVNSVEALSARIPILNHLVSLTEILFANFEVDVMHEWGLNYNSLLSLSSDGSVSESTLALQESVVSSPIVMGVAWNFILGLRLLLHSDEACVIRFGSKLLELAVDATEKLFHPPIHSEEVHQLFGYLASCQACSLIFRPTTTGAVIKKCESFLALFVQTSNFGRIEIALIWDLMNSSLDKGVREACLALLGFFAAKEFQPHQVAAILELLAGTDADVLWAPAFGFAKHCLQIVYDSGDLELWEASTTLLLPFLKRLAMPAQPTHVSQIKLKYRNEPLEAIEMITQYGISEDAMGCLIDDCLQQLHGLDYGPGGGSEVLRVLLLAAPGRIKAIGRLEGMDVIAFDALRNFLDNVGKLDPVDQQADGLAFSHNRLFHFLLTSISSLDHPTTIDHCQLWDYITGEKAVKPEWRTSSLKSFVHYARKFPNVAALVKKGVNDCLPTLDKSHASHGLLPLIAFIFSSASVNEPTELKELCKMVMKVVLSIDDKQLATDTAHILAAEVFSIAKKQTCDPFDDKYLPLALVDVCIDAIPSENLLTINVLRLLHLLSQRTTREYRKLKALDIGEIKLSEKSDLCGVSIEVHKPPGPAKLERWLLDPSITLLDFEATLKRQLEVENVRVYCKGQEAIISSKPDMTLSDFVSGNHELPILVKAVDTEKLRQEDQRILELLPSVERLIVDRLEGFGTMSGINGALGESISSLLHDIWHNSEITRERQIEPICGLDVQDPLPTWKDLFDMKIHFVALGQPWVPSELYSAAKIQTIKELIRLICEVGLCELILLHTALLVLHMHLKVVVDDEKRSTPYLNPEGFVPGFIEQMRSLVTDMQKPHEQNPSPRAARMLRECIVLLNTIILEIAACSEDAYACITTSDYDKEVLPWLLGFETDEVVDLTACAMRRVLISLPDAITEAKINPGNELVYTPAYLDRALKVKTWVSRHALVAVSQRLYRLHGVISLLHVAATSLSGSSVRKSLLDMDFQAHFDMLTLRLIDVPLDSAAAGDGSEVLIGSICLLLKGCVDALTDNDTRLQLSDYAVDILHGLLFVSTRGTDNDSPKTQPLVDTTSREYVFNLLKSIHSNGDHTFRVLELLSATIDSQDFPDDFKYPGRARFIKPADRPVGLENMSQTCYLNSLVQQLFHNNRFRALIREVPLLEGGSGGVLAALKATFAHLQHSSSTFFTPLILCEALGIEVNVQEDAGLFFQDLMSRLETDMPDDQWKKRLKSIFMITDKSQTIGECRHLSETSSVNLVLPLPVKDKKNLFESLDAYVAGSELAESEPFRCEKCQQEGKQYLVQASRRTCLSNIPDDLVIHLMKFQFDSEMGSRKINDPFEFPAKLDMAPYTMGSLIGHAEDSKEDEFELVGVVVHHGILAYGHYWSYVRLDSQDNTAPRWFRIEDADCREVNLDHVLAECQGSPTKSRDHSRMRLDNAFILFYRRKAESEATQEPPALTGEQDIESMVKANNEINRNVARLFDNDLRNYMNNILCDPDEALDGRAFVPCGEATIALALKYLTKILSHDSQSGHMQRLSHLISAATQGNSMRTLQVLHFLLDEGNATNLFLRASTSTRIYIGRLLLNSLESFKKADPITYGIPKIIRNAELVEDKDKLVSHVVHKLVVLAEQSSDYPRAWQTLFTLFGHIYDLGDVEAYAMASSRLVDICIEFLSTPGDDNLFRKHPEIAKAAFENIAILDWKSLAKFLSKLVDLPMKIPRSASAERGNEILYEYDIPIIMFTPEQTRALRRRDGDVYHFIYNLCMLCADDRHTPCEDWVSSMVLIPLLDNNLQHNFTGQVISFLFRQAEKADVLEIFYSFMEPLQAIGMQANTSPDDRADIIDLAIAKAHRHDTIAMSSIRYVNDLLPDSSRWRGPDAFIRWVCDIICSRKASIRKKMLWFLKKNVFQPLIEPVSSLQDQMRSSATVIDLMEDLGVAAFESIDLTANTSEHAVAAFLLGIETLTQRYKRFLDFRSARQLELLLATSIRGQREIDSEASKVHRVTALDASARRLKLAARALEVKFEPLMGGTGEDVEMNDAEDTSDELSSCSSGSFEEMPK